MINYLLSFYKFYFFARRFSNDNIATNQLQISDSFEKISFRSSLYALTSLQKPYFLIQRFFSGTKG